MTSTEIRHTNIGQIKKANEEKGFYWFSPETLRSFKALVESRVYETKPSYENPKGARVWVESMRNADDTGREFKVARFDVLTGDISYERGCHGAIITFVTKKSIQEYLECNLL